MGAKIRHHQLQKIPYMLIVGDDESEAGTVSVRPRTGNEQRGVSVESFLSAISAEIDERATDLALG